jgi:hypothetical protein
MTEPLPVLESARLEDLASELDSREDARDFAAEFLRLLSGRLRALSTAIEKDDQEAAHVALVSLAVSSGAVGALRLERDARLADREVLAGRMGEARGWIGGLSGDAEGAALALEEFLRHA